VSGANTHDSRLLAPTIDAAVYVAPKGEVANLCLDAGYTGKSKDVEDRGMKPHIRPRGEEKKGARGNKKPRRWVVERVFSRLNQFRKIKIRYEKLDVSHKGLLALCCAAIAFRQVISIYG
jgi:transposase